MIGLVILMHSLEFSCQVCSYYVIRTDKRGSKSLDSTNDGKDGVASRRMSTIGSMSGTSGCNVGRFRTLNSMKFRIIFD